MERLVTTFEQLNHGWNAEPNAPEPKLTVEGSTIRLRFVVNPFRFAFEEGATAELTFTECWRYRLGATNDEGWYRGQCRFSKLAPKWGEFYEVMGDPRATLVSPWEVIGRQPSHSRHLLFYLRDGTFECDAADWSVSLPPTINKRGP
jgi:hypothetical protein